MHVKLYVRGLVCSRTNQARTGELQSVDGYMNIALEKTEEFVNGQKRRAYGDAFVRGNNGNAILLICLSPPRRHWTR